MAVGGRVGQCNASFEQGCDFTYDYTCSPCTADGKNKEAITFCVECGEYLCGNCRSDHNRFAKMKSHQLVNPYMLISGRVSVTSSGALTLRCEKHHGKVLDMFCGAHKDVCCAVCLALDHSTCTGKVYIPDVAKGIQHSTEYKQRMEAYKTTLQQLATAKQKRNTELQLSKFKRDVIVDDLKKVRDDIIKKYDELEKASVVFVDSKFHSIASSIFEDVKKIDEVYDALQRKDTELMNEKNESQLFVLLMTGVKSLSQANTLLLSLNANTPTALDFKLHPEIDNCLDDHKVLGHFTQAVTCEMISVQAKDETRRCDITSCCQLDAGCLIIADTANQSIKRLESTFYKVIESCKMSSAPWSVCRLNIKEIAVSLHKEKRIQFLTTKGKLELSRSITVNDTCAGLTCVDYTLYAALSHRKQVHVYDHSGVPLKTIDLIGVGETDVPGQIAVCENHQNLYVATQRAGVISIDISTHTCHRLNIPEVRFASGIAVAADGSLYIACRDTNKIVHVNKGVGTTTIFSTNDGTVSPQSLVYLPQQQQLVVTAKDTDAIWIYSTKNV